MRFPIIIVYMEGDLFSTSRWLPCTCTFESWPCRFDLVVSLWVALLLFCPQFVPTHHLLVPGRSCIQILKFSVIFITHWEISVTDAGGGGISLWEAAIVTPLLAFCPHSLAHCLHCFQLEPTLHLKYIAYQLDLALQF